MAKSIRIKNKQAKRKQVEILSVKYSPKEIKKLDSQTREKEAKRIARNEKRKADRAASKQFLQAQGLDEKFINKHKLNNKLPKSYTAADLLRLKKQNALENVGINFTQSDLKLGWVKLQEKYPNVSIPENAWKHPPKTPAAPPELPLYLYVGAAEVRGGFHVHNYSSLSRAELEAQINDRINEALLNPDDSGSLYCVFKVYKGTKSDMEHIAGVFFNRGYDMNPKHLKLDRESYGKLTISNRWDARSFLSMVLNCITQMKNEDVSSFIDTMKEYCSKCEVDFMQNIQ